MGKPRLRAVIISAGAALALVAGGTAAGAAIAGPTDGSGVIHGCYTNKALNGTHVFVLQDAGTTCPAGTTAISWNQQGPAGPQGPQGATGPQGPQGPPGTFTGSLTSPNGSYSLNVTDSGIKLQGPGGTVTIGPAGVAVQGTQITLNGCSAPVARQGDRVDASGLSVTIAPVAATFPVLGTATIAGGSPTVCVG